MFVAEKDSGKSIMVDVSVSRTKLILQEAIDR